MRNLLLFVHILSAAALFGGVVSRVATVLFANTGKEQTDTTASVVLGSRAARFISTGSVLLLGVTAHFLLEPFKAMPIQSWVWVSLALTLITVALLILAGRQEKRLATDSKRSWGGVKRMWTIEMIASALSVLAVFYLMVAKSI